MAPEMILETAGRQPQRSLQPGRRAVRAADGRATLHRQVDVRGSPERARRSARLSEDPEPQRPGRGHGHSRPGARARRRQQRYQTAAEMGEACEHFLYDKGYGPTNLTLKRYLQTLFPEADLELDELSDGGDRRAPSTRPSSPSKPGASPSIPRASRWGPHAQRSRERGRGRDRSIPMPLRPSRRCASARACDACVDGRQPRLCGCSSRRVAIGAKLPPSGLRRERRLGGIGCRGQDYPGRRKASPRENRADAHNGRSPRPIRARPWPPVGPDPRGRFPPRVCRRTRRRRCGEPPTGRARRRRRRGRPARPSRCCPTAPTTSGAR